MSDGFPNTPRILRGAFMEYGITVPPLAVVFQFNPEELTRSRSIQYFGPHSGDKETSQENGGSQSTRAFHGRKEFLDLDYLQRHQNATVEEESISFDIRLDATDKLNEGDQLARFFGILPQLSNLELMVHPKNESIAGSILEKVGISEFSFSKRATPPIVLFIWGMHRVIPVNITSLNIQETEFNTQLIPIRAIASVGMKAIEGPNIPYMYTKGFKEMTAGLNMLNVVDIVIPEGL